jgi:hypothetical protein
VKLLGEVIENKEVHALPMPMVVSIITITQNMIVHAYNCFDK